MSVALAITIPICLTIIVVVSLMVWHRQDMSLAERKVQARLQTEKARTMIEVERWKQDWIIDQRREGGAPSLPPGTREIL